jgi:hypothetical protein
MPFELSGERYFESDKRWSIRLFNGGHARQTLARHDPATGAELIVGPRRRGCW